MPSTPLYVFGFGLSYSKFEVSDLKVASGTVARDGTLKVSVTLKNDSSVAGAEVVQLYTHQRAGSASRPVRELKAFTKVALGPNETKTVELEVKAEELGFWSPATQKWGLEPGAFDVWVGTDSEAKLHGEFSVR
jgi:beta-glucosidase